MMTGGTISTTRDSEGHLFANGEKTVSELVFNLKAGGKFDDVLFDIVFPLNILSENMTFANLDLLLDEFRKVDKNKYDGIIVAHGTDTLAYTSSLLSLVLAGFWDKPVMLVSSDYTLSDSRANGNDNFRAAVELIQAGFGGGVYVPYRNSDGVIYLHNGAHLRQCDNFTSDFYSSDMCKYTDAKAYMSKVEFPIIDSLDRFSESVMLVMPYVSLDYDSINLLPKYKAVLHGSYHSATACAQRRDSSSLYTSRSILHLVNRCKSSARQIFIAPLPEEMKQTSGTYSSTADILKSGIIPIFSLTMECAYMKLNLAYSLGYEGDEVEMFMNSELAAENL